MIKKILILLIIVILIASSAVVFAKDSVVQIKSGGKTIVITPAANVTVNNTNATLLSNDSIKKPDEKDRDADKKQENQKKDNPPKEEQKNEKQESKQSKNHVSNMANMLINLISRMKTRVNATSRISAVEKKSFLRDLDNLNSQAEEIKQKADAMSMKDIKKSDIVKDYKSVLKELKKVVRSIREQISSLPVKYSADTPIEQRCPDNYGLSSGTVVFYYSDEPHSNVMIPIVDELGTESYVFYKTNDLWNKRQEACFDLIGVTPTFVCAGTKEKLIGEVSREELKAFADRCKS